MPAFPDLFDDPAGLPTTTRSGIPYEVDALSYREQWRPGANATVIMARVATADAWDWVTDMVGRVYFGDVSGATRLRRDLPEQNPFDPKQWCSKVEQVDQGGVPDDGSTTDVDLGIVGVDPVPSFLDPATGWPLTKWIRYRCTFEGYPFPIITDADADSAAGGGAERELLRYVLRTRKFYPKEQQIPGGAFKTIDDAVPANRIPLFATGFKTVISGDASYVWNRVPVGTLPSAADSHQGKINSAEFDAKTALNPDGYAWPAGTLLYTGYDDTQKYWDANEDWVADVVFTFRYRQIGWNKYLNASGTAVEVSLDGTSSGAKPYSTADFHELFRASG